MLSCLNRSPCVAIFQDSLIQILASPVASTATLWKRPAGRCRMKPSRYLQQIVLKYARVPAGWVQRLRCTDDSVVVGVVELYGSSCMCVLCFKSEPRAGMLCIIKARIFSVFLQRLTYEYGYGSRNARGGWWRNARFCTRTVQYGYHTSTRVPVENRSRDGTSTRTRLGSIRGRGSS